MKFVFFALLVCNLGGCVWMERHPTATKVIVGSVFLSAGGYAATHKSGGNGGGPDVTIPKQPNCPGVSCK